MVGSCGGPSPQAKVASAVLSLMSDVVAAFVTKEGSSLDIVFQCGDQSGSEGSFSYAVPSVLSDPLQLLLNPDAAVSLAVTFNDCVINVCGERLVLSGGTATLDMGLSAAQVVSGSVPAAFTLRVSEQTFSGFQSGIFSYAYRIEANFDGGLDELSGISILDADPAQPIVIDGTTLDGAKVLEISEGC